MKCMNQWDLKTKKKKRFLWGVMLELRFERGVGKWDGKTRSFGELKTLYNDNRTIRDNRAYVKKWRGFPDGSAGKESACNAGDTGDVGSIPGLGRSPGGSHGKPLQYSCVENPMARGAWQATVHGGRESDMTWVTRHAKKWKTLWWS